MAFVSAMLWWWIMACGTPTPQESTQGLPPVPQEALPTREVRVPDQLSEVTPAPSSCPEGALGVPGGWFLMGEVSDEAGRDEQPVHAVYVDAFCLDQTEQAAAGGPAPLVVTSWEAAAAQCSDRGGRLPTEAEFEKAARGGCELGADPSRCDPGDLRPYPWGDVAPDCALANHSTVSSRGPRRCAEGPSTVDGQPSGRGPYGHLNLAGNLWEVTQDWYHPGVYRSNRSKNPGGPGSGRSHSLRGGAWNTFATNMRASNRFSDHIRGSALGVRCVFQAATPVIEDVPPLEWVDLTVTVGRSDGQPITGEWLTVTAFESRDLQANGMPAPGRSPVAEGGVSPAGLPVQRVPLQVPAGLEVKISAALDLGQRGTNPGPAASSGGLGWGSRVLRAEQGTEVSISLAPLPARPHSPRP